MRKSIQIAIIIFATVAPASAKAENKSATVRRFLLVGDSQAANLQAELRFKIGYAGHGFDSLSAVGTRATGWIKSGKLKRQLKAYDPDIVLACFGTNEAKFDTPVSALAEQFRSFADTVSDRGRRRVVWIAPPNLPGVAYLENVRQALGLTKGIEVIDLSNSIYAVNASGIHLTRAAYRVWAWDVWAWIADHSPALAVNR